MSRPLGQGPDHMYEMSECNLALEQAGLPLTPAPTGVTYASDQIRTMARAYSYGRQSAVSIVRAAQRQREWRRGTAD